MTTYQPPHKLDWGVYQEFEEIDDGLEDFEQSLPDWYSEPAVEINPYKKTWVIVQTFKVIEEEYTELERVPENPFPHKSSWQCYQETSIIYEFEVFQDQDFIEFDETLIGRLSLGIVLNSGFFEDLYSVIYDSGEFNSEGLRGLTVKKILAEISVYDSLHSSPGDIYKIPEDLGGIQTEAESPNPQLILDDPNNNVVSNEVGINFVVDSPDATSNILVGDGDTDPLTLIVSGNSNPTFDKPPGALLATLSYEIVGGIATITAWSHPNWEDDSPLIKAVQTMLNTLPECVFEVQVEDDPTPFWTSLGFHSAVKGDPYLRFYRS